ncbi:MAG: hypothetical protein HGA65_13110, partial [Oscillochloris sp.]|nr:hypothetical protein [Oscillochloris sp.]
MKRVLSATLSVAASALLATSFFQAVPSVAAAQASHATTSLIAKSKGGPPAEDGTRAGGQVTAVGDDSITVTGRDDTTKEILVTDETEFDLDGESASLSDIEVDQHIFAEGTTTSGVFTATVVHVSTSQPQAPAQGGQGGAPTEDGTRAGGKVTAVGDDSITVAGPDDTTKEILVTDETEFDLDGESASLSDIEVDQHIFAEGTTTSGVFTATVVHVSTSQPQA